MSIIGTQFKVLRVTACIQFYKNIMPKNAGALSFQMSVTEKYGCHRGTANFSAVTMHYSHFLALA